MNRSRILLLLILAVLVGGMLRLIGLDRKSIWLDESATAMFASGTVQEITSPGGDPHPPLYYLIMHYWSDLGKGEFLLRLPSAIAGILTIPLMYWLVREWSDERAALVGAWLLALAPMHLWYSQEARMYALVTFFGVSSTLCYSLALHRKRPLWWLGWVVATLLGLYTQYSMFVVVFLQIVLFVPLWRQRGASTGFLAVSLVALLVVGALYIPQARRFATQFLEGGGGGSSWYFMALQQLLDEVGIMVSLDTLTTLFKVAAVVSVVVLVGVVWTILRRDLSFRFHRWHLIGATLIYVGLLLAWVVPRGFSVKRQSVILLPHLLGIIGFLFSRIDNWRRMMLIALLVTLPVTIYVVGFQEQESWREAVQYVEEREQEGDILLFSAPYVRMPFNYYYDGDLEGVGLLPEDLPERLEEAVANHDRVWLVLSHEEYSDPQGKIEQVLDQDAALVSETPFKRIRIRLYDLSR
ncbi:MAG: glycosyltransferase family 39 protein [Anaerolineae bacterium]